MNIIKVCFFVFLTSLFFVDAFGDSSTKSAYEKANETRLSPFGQAFKKARELGQKIFEFKGKKYTTKLKGEKKKKPLIGEKDLFDEKTNISKTKLSKKTSFTKKNYFLKGKKLFDEKKFSESKFKFEQDIVFNPKSEKSYLYLAKIFKKEENDKLQEQNLNTVILLNPKNEKAIFLLTLLKIKKSDYKESGKLIKTFKKICKNLCEKEKELSKTLQDLQTK